MSKNLFSLEDQNPTTWGSKFKKTMRLPFVDDQLLNNQSSKRFYKIYSTFFIYNI
ncbi:hypothetical protein Hanom_Chr09g00852901 [Helianthus anomalus]